MTDSGLRDENPGSYIEADNVFATSFGSCFVLGVAWLAPTSEKTLFNVGYFELLTSPTESTSIPMMLTLHQSGNDRRLLDVSCVHSRRERSHNRR